MRSTFHMTLCGLAAAATLLFGAPAMGCTGVWAGPARTADEAADVLGWANELGLTVDEDAVRSLRCCRDGDVYVHIPEETR